MVGVSWKSQLKIISCLSYGDNNLYVKMMVCVLRACLEYDS